MHIGIFTGLAWETWDLNTYKERGIGGSETAAGRLAEIAAEEGHRVTLYGQVEAKRQHGVELVPWKRFNCEEEFDVCILSRDLSFLRQKIRAKKVIAWIQDICLAGGGPLSDTERAQVDFFVTLSPWHRDFFKQYYNLPDEKLKVIPHGVNIELFDPFDSKKKVHGRLLWSSSPDRGLENLFSILPKIREEIPDLHLEVAYGFHNWLSYVVKRQDLETLTRIDRMKAHMQACDYITYRGRLSQQELAKCWQKASLWLYPTEFHETYCVSAMEAQASGTPIICSNLAALKTTAGSHGHLIDPPAYSKIGQAAFIEKTIEFLSDSRLWVEMSQKSLQGAHRVSWKNRWEDFWKPLLESH